MRDCVAPEARGSASSARLICAGRRALLQAAAAGVACAALCTRASLAVEAPQRELRPSADTAKPNFILQTVQEAPADLSRYAGRVVLVHFFATWCEPCREELASLNALVARRSGDVSVLALNVAEVPARVRRFLETTAVDFPVLLDTDRAVTKAWGVSILPTTFILDRSLVPRLWVEGDLDWTRTDVLAALDEVGAVLRR